MSFWLFILGGICHLIVLIREQPSQRFSPDGRCPQAMMMNLYSFSLAISSILSVIIDNG